jgi:ABC-type enterochelin transport system substrate-binding protein
MIKKNTVVVAVFALLVSASAVLAQDKAQAQKSPAKASAPAAASTTVPKEQNLKEYVKLLREDVRSQKYSVVDAVMQLDLDQAAKFWPIYRDYDAELSKVNDLRVANIEEYSQAYNHLTDEKADELVRNAMEFQKQRDELLGKYYLRMKQEMGGITAARFLQVEHQLLLIIDLQISSSLPVAGS